jgi:hypothetical protein
MKFQYQDENFHFLKARIREMRTAVFRTERNAVVDLPVNVIKTLTVEDDGTILFFTTCKSEVHEDHDPRFYAYLDYHNRATQSRLRVSGIATIVKDDDHALFALHKKSEGAGGKLVLVRMKMLQAEFAENREMVKLSWAERLRHVFDTLLPLSSQRVYNFSK